MSRDYKVIKSFIALLDIGVSFTFNEVIEMFLLESDINDLKNELVSFESEMNLQDWELNKNVAFLFDKYGKNSTKKIIAKLKSHLF